VSELPQAELEIPAFVAVGTDSNITYNNDPGWRGPVVREFKDAFFAITKRAFIG
jgi:hypothetical protein